MGALVIPVRTVLVKHVEDATDISIADIAVGQSNFGSPFNLVVPNNGSLSVVFAGRLQTDSGTLSPIVYMGVRIAGANYWFGRYNANGTITDPTTITGVNVAAGFEEWAGTGPASGTATCIAHEANVKSMGLPAGLQSAQMVCACIGGRPASLRGTVKPSRLVLTIKEAG